MDPNQKEQILRCLLLIIIGLVGLIFYLLYPFDHQSLPYIAALLCSIIISVAGLVLLPLGIAKKLPISFKIPTFLIGFFGLIGTFFCIFFVISPDGFPPFFIVGIIFLEIAGYQTWISILHRKQKQTE